MAFMAPLLTGLGQLAIVVAMSAGGSNVLDGAGLSVGDVSTFTQYMGLIITPSRCRAGAAVDLPRRCVAARILEAYETEATITDRPDLVAIEHGDVRGRIVFDDVTFAFRRADGTFDPGTEAHQPHDRARPAGRFPRRHRGGEVGAREPDSPLLRRHRGEDHDRRRRRARHPLRDLRKIVGVALQEAVLFQDELRPNLKFGAPDVEDEVMFDAARAADAYGFVTNLPDQWKAELHGAATTSPAGSASGSRITWALTPQPRVLILDDSTSALDASTEGRVQAAIPEFMGGTTTIYVAQRISVLIDLDHIYLLEHGEIIAEGTHDELLATSPMYQEIFESQLGGGITAGLDLEGAS